MIISAAGLAGAAFGAWWCYSRPSFLSTKKCDPAADYIAWQRRQRQPHAAPESWRFNGFNEEDEHGNRHGDFEATGYISGVEKKYHLGLYLHFSLTQKKFSGGYGELTETPAGGLTRVSSGGAGHHRLFHLVALSNDEEAEWLSNEDHAKLAEAAATVRKVRISGRVWRRDAECGEGGFDGFGQDIHCPIVRNLEVEFLD
jgi:hypothetical protein